jgi:hypothetical protein
MVGKITVQGNLASDQRYAMLIIRDLGAKSKIDIGGTAEYGAGAGKNRIRIGGQLDGQISVGTKILNGLFGDVVVVDSANSAGKLIADAQNGAATIFAQNPGGMTYASATTSGTAWANLFGAQTWPEA